MRVRNLTAYQLIDGPKKRARFSGALDNFAFFSSPPTSIAFPQRAVGASAILAVLESVIFFAVVFSKSFFSVEFCVNARVFLRKEDRCAPVSRSATAPAPAHMATTTKIMSKKWLHIFKPFGKNDFEKNHRKKYDAFENGENCTCADRPLRKSDGCRWRGKKCEIIQRTRESCPLLWAIDQLIGSEISHTHVQNDPLFNLSERDPYTVLKDYGPIELWDVSKLTTFDCAFDGWNTIPWSSGAFSNFNANISNWDVSRATSLKNMFRGRPSIFNQPIGKWVVDRVVDMSGMLYGAHKFDQILSGWNTSQVTDEFRKQKKKITPFTQNEGFPTDGSGTSCSNCRKGDFHLKFFA